MPLLFDRRYGSHPHGFRPETRFERILTYIVFILIVLVFIIGLLVAIFKSPSDSKSVDKASKDKPNEDNSTDQPKE